MRNMPSREVFDALRAMRRELASIRRSARHLRLLIEVADRPEEMVAALDELHALSDES